MKYSPKFFRDTMPAWKRKKDSVVARVFHRPISFVFSSLFAEMGLSANQVSFLSLVIAVVACVFLGIPNLQCAIIGAVMVNLWSILDSADGNIARSIGGKPYGDFIDATSSYFLVGFMFPAIGYSVYVRGGFWVNKGDGLIILLGAIAGLSDTMMRLFFQKMKNGMYENDMHKNSEDNSSARTGKIAKIQTRIESELGIGGWNMIAIVLCAIWSTFDLYIGFYLIYNLGMFISSFIYMLKKTKCLR